MKINGYKEVLSEMKELDEATHMTGKKISTLYVKLTGAFDDFVDAFAELEGITQPEIAKVETRLEIAWAKFDKVLQRAKQKAKSYN